MPKFEKIEGGSGSAGEKNQELAQLIGDYSCGVGFFPEWCVYGQSVDGSHGAPPTRTGPAQPGRADSQSRQGVLFWIRPAPESELRARRIAKLITELGGHATAEKTEWNDTLKGKAVYYHGENIDFILGKE